MALFGYSVFLLQHRQGGSVYNPGCDGKAGTPDVRRSDVLCTYRKTIQSGTSGLGECDAGEGTDDGIRPDLRAAQRYDDELFAEIDRALPPFNLMAAMAEQNVQH